MQALMYTAPCQHYNTSGAEQWEKEFSFLAKGCSPLLTLNGHFVTTTRTALTPQQS